LARSWFVVSFRETASATSHVCLLKSANNFSRLNSQAAQL
jgi:hypothetical protein